MYGVLRSTPHNRMKDTTSHTVPFEHLQVLLRETEKRLAEWILVQHALGAPSTHAQVKDFAQRLARQHGHVSDLGKRWVRHFMARNPSVRTQRAKKIDSVRLNGATATTITAWFKYLADLSISLIKPENRWNKDKTSILEGQGSNGLVIGSSEMKALIKKQPGSRNWTTFVECISATGVALPPLVIMKGKTVQQQHYPEDLKPYADWKFTATEKGWIDDDTALEWLLKVFIPGTQVSANERRLLVVNGHHN